jgi:hypothetical protein
MTIPRWSGQKDEPVTDAAERAAGLLFRAAAPPPALSPSARVELLERVVEHRAQRAWRTGGRVRWLMGAAAVAATVLVVAAMWGRGRIDPPAGPRQVAVASIARPAAPDPIEVRDVVAAEPAKLRKNAAGEPELEAGRVRLRTRQAPARVVAGRATLRLAPHTQLQVAVAGPEIQVTCFAGEATVTRDGHTATVKEHFELVLPAAAPPQLRPLNAPSHPAPAAPAPPPAPDAAPAAAAPRGRKPAVAVPAAAALDREADELARALHMLHRRGQPARALELLEQHQHRFPRGALRLEVRRARLDALLQLGRRDQALRLLDAEVLAGPHALAGTAELLTIRGELRARAGRCREAEQDFDALLARGASALQPAFQERALFGRASCRARRHDQAGARADLEAYRDRFPRGTFIDRVRRSLAEQP